MDATLTLSSWILAILDGMTLEMIIKPRRLKVKPPRT